MWFGAGHIKKWQEKSGKRILNLEGEVVSSSLIQDTMPFPPWAVFLLDSTAGQSIYPPVEWRFRER